MKNTESLFCDTCKADVTETGRTQSYKADGTIVSTLCMPCDDAARVVQYLKDRVLSTSLIERASLEHSFPYSASRRRGRPMPVEMCREIMASSERIQVEIGRFETEVWFDGMQAFARNASVKGTEFDAGKVAVMCFTMCGRAMMTVEGTKRSKGCSVTTITDETAPPRSAEDLALYKRGMMGLRGIDATEAEAIALLRAARGTWLAREAFGYKMIEKREVTLGVPGLGMGA